jgi:hypothetical protein
MSKAHWASNTIRKLGQLASHAKHFVANNQPTERIPDNPLMIFFQLPQGGVFTPDPAHDVSLLGLPNRVVDEILVFP